MNNNTLDQRIANVLAEMDALFDDTRARERVSWYNQLMRSLRRNGSRWLMNLIAICCALAFLITLSGPEPFDFTCKPLSGAGLSYTSLDNNDKPMLFASEKAKKEAIDFLFRNCQDDAAAEQLNGFGCRQFKDLEWNPNNATFHILSVRNETDVTYDSSTEVIVEGCTLTSRNPLSFSNLTATDLGSYRYKIMWMKTYARLGY